MHVCVCVCVCRKCPPPPRRGRALPSTAPAISVYIRIPVSQRIRTAYPCGSPQWSVGAVRWLCIQLQFKESQHIAIVLQAIFFTGIHVVLPFNNFNGLVKRCYVTRIK